MCLAGWGVGGGVVGPAEVLSLDEPPLSEEGRTDAPTVGGRSSPGPSDLPQRVPSQGEPLLPPAAVVLFKEPGGVQPLEGNRDSATLMVTDTSGCEPPLNCLGSEATVDTLIFRKTSSGS